MAGKGSDGESRKRMGVAQNLRIELTNKPSSCSEPHTEALVYSQRISGLCDSIKSCLVAVKPVGCRQRDQFLEIYIYLR